MGCCDGREQYTNGNYSYWRVYQMKTFEMYISERRRNPDQNPRISAYDALLKYKDDSDMYISFTSKRKIGINPASDYNTPLSIYTYPLKEIWKGFDHKHKRIVVPFAGQYKHIWVLKQTGTKFIKNMNQDYLSSDYDRDMMKLRDLYEKESMASVTKDAILFSAKKITRAIIGINSNQDSKHLVFGSMIENVYDVIKIGVISWDEFKLKVNAFQSLDKDYTQVEVELKKLNDMFIANSISFIEKQGAQNARFKSPIGIFWYVTMKLAEKLATGGQFKPRGVKIGNKTSRKWNSVLRSLGYAGFADKDGKGIIHSSEPMQAIFLDKKSFKVIELIYNEIDK